MERRVSIVEAERDLAEIIDRVCNQKESAIITRSGIPVARLVPIEKPPLLGNDLAKILDQMPHLTREDAEEFEKELQESRSKLQLPTSKWE